MGDKKGSQKITKGTKFWTSYGSSGSDIYNTRDFRDVKFREMYGDDFSEKNQKKFKAYLESEQGLKDWDNFDRQEHNRYIVNVDKTYNNSVKKAAEQSQKVINTPLVPKTPIIETKPVVEENPVVEETTVETVPTPTTPNTLLSKTWDQIRQNALSGQPVLSEAEKAVLETKRVIDNNTTSFINSPYTRNIHGMKSKRSVNIDGKEYQIMVTTGLRGLFPGQWNNDTGIENDRTYALDPETGNVRAVWENVGGIPGARWADYSSWMPMSDIEKAANNIAKKENDMIKSRLPKTETGSVSYDPSDYIGMDKKGGILIKKHLKGGTMNKIKYFQNGGAAPQQDMQQQIIQLVQAAMSGDQKATETVNKIMEAAKAGDQQAMQIAQMIQQVAQQMQGQQAPSAKWGSKLSYIKNLKYAKGGKACPACQKKVEEKACGGKTKKRYFGGWL